VVASFAADEAWDALLGVKTAEAGTTGAAAGDASLCSSFVLLENEEQFVRPASPTTFLFLIYSNFVTCISPS
jgi:hypothetical protein